MQLPLYAKFLEKVQLIIEILPKACMKIPPALESAGELFSIKIHWSIVSKVFGRKVYKKMVLPVSNPTLFEKSLLMIQVFPSFFQIQGTSVNLGEVF